MTEKAPLLKSTGSSHSDLPTFQYHPPSATTSPQNNSHRVPRNVSFSVPPSANASFHHQRSTSGTQQGYKAAPHVSYKRQKPPHLQGNNNEYSDDTEEYDDEDGLDDEKSLYTKFMEKVSAVIDRIQQFSFIAILMVYSAVITFIFAIILFLMGPPTKVNIIPIITGNYNWSLSSSSASSSSLFPSCTTSLNNHHHKVLLGGTSGGRAGRQSRDDTKNEKYLLEEFLQQQQQNESSDNNITVQIIPTDPISFLDAWYMTFGSYSGTGLSVVNYSLWEKHVLVFVCVMITFGSYVLLTLLPAVFRYRALCQERRKLIYILDWTGSYMSDEVKRKNRLREEEQERQRQVLQAQAEEREKQAEAEERRQKEEAERIQTGGSTATNGSFESASSMTVSRGDHHNNINASTVSSTAPIVEGNNINNNNNSLPVVQKKRKKLTSDLVLSHTAADPRKASTYILNYTGEHKPQDDIQNAAAMVMTGHSLKTNASSVNSMYGLTNESPTSATIPASESGSIGSPLFPAMGDVEKIERRKKRQAKKIAKSLTFGKRIVYEDGLANVNQQIDICLIIIFGVLFYWFFFHVLFILLCMAGGKSFWWSAFHTISAFNNAGLALSPLSMIPISKDVWLMFVLTLAMMLGNPLFPVFFRFQLSLLHRLIRRITTTSNHKYAKTMMFGQPLIVWQHSVRLLLRYPRKYYTHCFSKYNTLLLFLLWFAVTLIGLVLFFFEWDKNGVFESGSSNWEKFWVAFFQSVSVRSTGFNIIDLNYVQDGHLAWWLLAMYTAAYPFIITVRATQHTYEYDEDDPDNLGQGILSNNPNEASTAADLRREATGLLGRDLLWLYSAVLIICYAEKASISDPNHDYSLFLRICFEVASAFGNVGLSLSLPNTDYSYSGSLSTFSLWLMIAVMFFGKHRGLPKTLDDAIAISVRNYDFSSGDLDPDFSSSSSGDDDVNTSNNNEQKKNENDKDQDQSSSNPSTLTNATTANMSSKSVRFSNDDEQQKEGPSSKREKKRRRRHNNKGDDDDDDNNDDDDKLLKNDLYSASIPKLKTVTIAAENVNVLTNVDKFIKEEDAEIHAHDEGHHQHEGDETQQQSSSNAAASAFAAADASTPAESTPQPTSASSSTTAKTKSILKDADLTFFLNEKGELVKMSKDELFKRRVRAFYEHYNPARIEHLDRIVAGFTHNKQALLRNLALCYGPEPSIVQQKHSSSSGNQESKKDK